jgi:hypothetical protein
MALAGPAAAQADSDGSGGAPIAGIVRPISTVDGSPIITPNPIGGASKTCVEVTQNCGPMSFKGGTVMKTTNTYAIFWGTLPSGYQTLVERFFTDIASDSGKATNIYSVIAQYTDKKGTITYNSHFGGSYVDSSTPSGSCSGYSAMGQTLTSCVTDSDLQAKVASAMSSKSWTADETTLFFVFTAQGVGSVAGSAKAYTDYCGYHSSFTSGGKSVIYANIPYDAVSGGGSTCEPSVSPNNNAADAALNVASHEYMEAATDSFWNTSSYGWVDKNLGSGEVGDKCNFTFGTLANNANQTINGHSYLLQEEWSNKGSKCLGSLAATTANKFAKGQILLGLADGSVERYTTAGKIVSAMRPGVDAADSMTSMTVDSSNNLYVVNATTKRIDQYDQYGAWQVSPFNQTGLDAPKSVVYNASTNKAAASHKGHLFVGQSGTGSNVKFIYELDNTGTVVSGGIFNVLTGTGGTDWLSFQSDGCTLLYTSRDSTIYDYNVCTSTQKTGGYGSVSGATLGQVRAHTDGTVLAADTTQIYRLIKTPAKSTTPVTTLKATYVPTLAGGATITSFAIAGSTLWAGDTAGTLHKFAMNGTGTVTETSSGNINTLHGTGITGVQVIGES